MPFGICDAPATFQHCMLVIFTDFVEKSIEVFMDDFSVFGSSFDSCLSNLDTVLEQCVEINLMLNWEMPFYGNCNDPPRRYGIHTLIFDNFNLYKKNSLNFIL